MPKVKTNINKALENVEKEIRNNASGGGMFARGLAAEGYAGGYRDALMDIILVMNGIKPNRRNYWEEFKY